MKMVVIKMGPNNSIISALQTIVLAILAFSFKI